MVAASRLWHLAVRVFPLLIFAALWQTASVVAGPNQDFVPGLASIGHAVVELMTGVEIRDNLFITLLRAFAGLALATVIGIAVGIGMARSEAFNAYVYPIVGATYSLPKAALVPLLILWIGVGNMTDFLVVFLACLLPVIVQTQQGIASTPTVAVWSAESMGASPRRILWTVRLPHALPSIFTGLRIALGFSFVLAVSAEMIASTSGIGKLIFMYGQNGAYAFMFAAILFILIVAFLADRLLLALGDWYLRWNDQR